MFDYLIFIKLTFLDLHERLLHFKIVFEKTKFEIFTLFSLYQKRFFFLIKNNLMSPKYRQINERINDVIQ